MSKATHPIYLSVVESTGISPLYIKCRPLPESLKELKERLAIRRTCKGCGYILKDDEEDFRGHCSRTCYLWTYLPEAFE